MSVQPPSSSTARIATPKTSADTKAGTLVAPGTQALKPPILAPTPPDMFTRTQTLPVAPPPVITPPPPSVITPPAPPPAAAAPAPPKAPPAKPPAKAPAPAPAAQNGNDNANNQAANNPFAGSISNQAEPAPAESGPSISPFNITEGPSQAAATAEPALAAQPVDQALAVADPAVLAQPGQEEYSPYADPEAYALLQAQLAEATGNDPRLMEVLLQIAMDPEGGKLIQGALARGTRFQVGGLSPDADGETTVGPDGVKIAIRDPNDIQSLAHELVHASSGGAKNSKREEVLADVIGTRISERLGKPSDENLQHALIEVSTNTSYINLPSDTGEIDRNLLALGINPGVDTLLV